MPTQDLLLIAGVIGLWYALNRWILPALGIPTCMSGQCCSSSSCSVPSDKSGDKETSAGAQRSGPAVDTASAAQESAQR